MKGRVLFIGRRIKVGVLLSLAALLVMLSSWAGELVSGPESVGTTSTGIPGKSLVALYFDASQGGDYYLAREIRRLETVVGVEGENLVMATLQELLTGPQLGGLEATIPPGTSVVDVMLEDGIAQVVFSSELAIEHWGGSTREELTLGSIANTLTSLPGIKGVTIQIEGWEAGSLAGHIDLAQVFTYNSDLVR